MKFVFIIIIIHHIGWILRWDNICLCRPANDPTRWRHPDGTAQLRYVKEPWYCSGRLGAASLYAAFPCHLPIRAVSIRTRVARSGAPWCYFYTTDWDPPLVRMVVVVTVSVGVGRYQCPNGCLLRKSFSCTTSTKVHHHVTAAATKCLCALAPQVHQYRTRERGYLGGCRRPAYSCWPPSRWWKCGTSGACFVAACGVLTVVHDREVGTIMDGTILCIFLILCIWLGSRTLPPSLNAGSSGKFG